MSLRSLLFGGIAVAGAVVALGISVAAGMEGRELGHLALMLAIAVPVTFGAVLLAARVLTRASVRRSLLGVALLSALAGLANLAALVGLMLVDDRDAVLVAALLVYSLAAGIGTALALGAPASRALARLDATARRLAEGDLSARAGRLDAGRDLDSLARTLDQMAARLDAAIGRERAIEAQRHDLITAVSHDLRTPLASLRAMIEAIDEGVVDHPSELARYAAEMRRSIGSLSELVDDLFEIVQLEAAAIEAEGARATVADVVQVALAACDAHAAHKRLRVETALSGAGDAACSPRLGRVLQNLLQNAIRHTPADGTVRIEAARRGNALRVTVSDEGEGIPPESLERVFDPFWRGEAARSSAGSGLGLTLARRIVEALGGRITVESRPTHGSRFAVLVPRL